MKKQMYQAPAMTVVNVELCKMIAGSASVTSVSSESTGLQYGGGSDGSEQQGGSPRSRMGGWDEE